MSAGICGKRVGFEDIFGSQSSPSAKRSRCSPFGSPTRCSDLGFGSEDKLSLLFRMFPSVDRKVVQSVLDSHDNKIDDAIKNLRDLCLGNDHAEDEAASLNSAVLVNDNGIAGIMGNVTTGQIALPSQDGNSEKYNVFQDGSSWLDLFLQEMRNASSWEDIRDRASKFLETFEKSVLTHTMASKEDEIALLKEQLQCMLRDNNILKKGIQIQHERNFEQEEKLKEVPHLKHFLSQCQEQIRKLEMDNYALRIRLQTAQDSNSIPNHFNRHIF